MTKIAVSISSACQKSRRYYLNERRNSSFILIQRTAVVDKIFPKVFRFPFCLIFFSTNFSELSTLFEQTIFSSCTYGKVLICALVHGHFLENKIWKPFLIFAFLQWLFSCYTVSSSPSVISVALLYVDINE